MRIPALIIANSGKSLYDALVWMQTIFKAGP